MRLLVAVVAWVSWSLAVVACGGSVASVGPMADAGSTHDGATTDAAPGAGGDSSPTPLPDDATPPPDVSIGPADAGSSPCAAPTNTAQSALCITVSPEAIAFTSNPSFDGKGEMSVAVYNTALPDTADGGTVTALAAEAFSGNSVDLSKPLPTIRFDNLPPGQVYARTVFVDDPNPGKSLGAGFWLGGYDLSNGLMNETPLMPVTLTAGSATSITMDLVALRQLIVTLTLASGTIPEGNGQGPGVFIVTQTSTPASNTAFFGVGESTCSTVSASQPATVDGFVFGDGPYYVVGALDDFGPGANASALPAGSLVSLTLASGTLRAPASDALSYAATAYNITASVALDLVVPGDAGVDTVSCP